MYSCLLSFSLATLIAAAPAPKDEKKNDTLPAVVDDTSGLTFTVDPAKPFAVLASDKNGKAVWKFEMAADPKIKAGARVVVMQIAPNNPALLRVLFDRGEMKTEIELDTKTGKLVSQKDGK